MIVRHSVAAVPEEGDNVFIPGDASGKRDERPDHVVRQVNFLRCLRDERGLEKRQRL